MWAARGNRTMTAKNEKDEDAAEIRRLLIDYHAAMVEADIEKLSGLLDMDFFLVISQATPNPKTNGST